MSPVKLETFVFVENLFRFCKHTHTQGQGSAGAQVIQDHNQKLLPPLGHADTSQKQPAVKHLLNLLLSPAGEQVCSSAH